MWPVKLGLKDFPCGGGDAMMSLGWSAVTMSKNLCCPISGYASSYDPIAINRSSGNKSLISALVSLPRLGFFKSGEMIAGRMIHEDMSLDKTMVLIKTKIFEAVAEGTTKDGDVVHKHLHAILDKLMEYCRHASLKRSWGIA
ncbi:hypothetical protein Tco_0369035 [Tanacetum coccineum]